MAVTRSFVINIFRAVLCVVAIWCTNTGAQSVPTCPGILPSNFVIVGPPLRPPISTEPTGFLNFGSYLLGFFQFEAVNISISGNQIDFDAVSAQRFPGTPLNATPIATLSAGTYTVNVRPIWTAVVPTYVCPTQTVTVQVQAGFVDVPVPAPHGRALGLLAGLLALGAGLAFRQRKRV